MKTYTTTARLGRLTAYLIAVHKPFVFDGTAIEFTASENFVKQMIAEDPALAKVEFEIR